MSVCTKIPGIAMASVLWLASPGLSHAPVEPDIYGDDDRYELYEVSDAKIRRWARAVAVMVPKKLVTPNGRFREGPPSLAQIVRAVSRAGKKLPVARHERFADQPLYGVGTAFLVGPDLLVTAGHCVKSAEDLKNYYFVFGYELDPTTQHIRRSVGAKNVFEGREVIYSTATVRADRKKHDYALIRLSRSATVDRNGRPNGRKPLAFRRDGKVSDSARLVMIGYPIGLPLKVTDSGLIRDNRAETSFVTTLDAFGGNSGSPVIDAATGRVEGILVRGSTISWREVVIGGRGFAETIKFDEDSGGIGTDVERITNVKALRDGLSEGIQIFDAMRAGDLERVVALLEAGARLKGVRDLEGRNYLHVAMATKRIDMARLFLTRGVSCKARDRSGNTPLHAACRNGFLRGVAALLARGAPVNATNSDGETPYVVADEAGHSRTARYLVKKGANTKIRPKDWQKLSEELIRAAKDGDTRRVMQLVAMPRVDVNLGDDTPLIWAAYNGHAKVIEALMTRLDLDVNAENARGANALLWARHKKRTAIQRLLRSRGARTGKLEKWIDKFNANPPKGTVIDYKVLQPKLRYGFRLSDTDRRSLDPTLIPRLRSGDGSATFSAGLQSANRKDWRSALKWYSRSADRGVAAAMNNLGLMYEQARGVEKDHRRAFRLYLKAARKGSSVAMRNAGNCYERGRGVEKSPADALAWYRAAKKAGNKSVDSAIRRLQPATGVKTVAASTFESEVLGNHGLSMVYFRGDNGLSRVFDRVLKQLTERYAGQLSFYRMDADDARTLMKEFGVRGTPGVRFFKQGRPIGSPITGVRSKKGMAKAIDDLLKPE